MEQIILIIVGFLAVAYLFDMWRQSVAKKNSADGPDQSTASEPQQREPLTANEAMPTQTGRFRAKQVLEKAAPEDSADESEREKKTEEDEEDEALPDPFAK